MKKYFQSILSYYYHRKKNAVKRGVEFCRCKTKKGADGWITVGSVAIDNRLSAKKDDRWGYVTEIPDGISVKKLHKLTLVENVWSSAEAALDLQLAILTLC